MTVEAAEGDLVEVNEAETLHAGAGEGGAGVRADAAAANNDDEGRAQPAQALLTQKDAVARQLLENQLVVEIAVLRTVRQRLVVLVFFIGFGQRSDSSYLEREE